MVYGFIRAVDWEGCEKLAIFALKMHTGCQTKPHIYFGCATFGWKMASSSHGPKKAGPSMSQLSQYAALSFMLRNRTDVCIYIF